MTAIELHAKGWR